MDPLRVLRQRVSIREYKLRRAFAIEAETLEYAGFAASVGD
jgi:hypothetical protein